MCKPLKVFIIYSHKDTAAKDKLITYLGVLRNEGLIDIWHDNEILASDKWRDVISSNLAKSDLLLYLVSAASLASENSNKKLAEALKANIPVIPIILEHCDWLSHQLSNFVVLPDNGMPIAEWAPESDGWQSVAEGIRKSVNKIQHQIDWSFGTSQRKLRAELTFQQGNVLMMLSQIDKSIEVYSHAIELCPNYGEFYNNRGVAYDIKGNFDRAIKDYTKAIELKPDDASAYNNRGIACGGKGDYDRAIEEYDKAIELKPDFAEAHYNRGIDYQNKGDFDRAIEDFNKAIAFTPDYASAYNNRGVVYIDKGDFNRAIEDFNTAIALKPDLAETYYNRGEVRLRLREWDKAKADLITAQEMGVDIVAAFRTDYRNTIAFEQTYGFKLPEDIAALVLQDFRSRYPRMEKVLTADGKSRESPEVLSLVEKLRRTGTPLWKYLKMSPYFGIKTVPTEVFIVDGATREDLIAAHSSSADILKPFLHGRDIRRWQVESQDRWLIFAHRGIEINAYPAIQKYLEKYRGFLSKRRGKGKWYEVQVFPDESERFAKPKLVSPNLYNGQTFAVETEGFYCGYSCCIIPTEETWLCGMLNTRTVEWFYSQTSKQLGSGELQARSGYIKQIPIPDVNATQKDLVRKFVDYLIYLQKQPTTSSKDLIHANDFVMLKYFEQIINGLFYEFYMPDVMQEANRDLFKHLMAEHLPEVEEIHGDKMPAFRALYKHLYHREHPVRVNLFFQDSLKPIRIIEDKW